MLRIVVAVTFVVAVAASSLAQLVVSADRKLCPTAKYSSIQSAVDASPSGATIYVCPGTYDEQVTISKPLTVRGIQVGQKDRVQIQPSTFSAVSDNAAVITVQNTNNVFLKDLAVDASKNTVSGCTPTLSAVHFFNAGGEVADSAISGAKITNPSSCATLSGNGFGILAEATGSGSLGFEVERNSVHDYSKDGVRVMGNGLKANIDGNVISGLGPAAGFSFQFGVFVLNGAVAWVRHNQITEGDCGSLSVTDCINARSEGIVLRAVGDGSAVDYNVISRVQSGIFINFANKASISHNLVSNVFGLDAIDAQGMSNSVLDGNSVFNGNLSSQSCGITEVPGPGNAGGTEANNWIVNNQITDAWCGLAFASTSHLQNNRYHDVLFTAFRYDVGPPQ